MSLILKFFFFLNCKKSRRQIHFCGNSLIFTKMDLPSIFFCSLESTFQYETPCKPKSRLWYSKNQGDLCNKISCLQQKYSKTEVYSKKRSFFFPNLRLFYCIFRLAHHHHGIPMPPPSVMLSMPPPTVNMASGNVMTTHAPQHITPHSNHMHIQHVVHHHSP